jgi:predicted nuclease of restriction endonuclease-like (RecB) superfamily
MVATKQVIAAKLPLYGRVSQILDTARSGIARTVNSTQVLANWLVGAEIVEEEQGGASRADYGAKLLARLSLRLTRNYGRGYSVDNLEAFRQFYLNYPQLISETVRRKLVSPQISVTVSRKLSASGEPLGHRPGRLHPDLSWSHYRSLLRVSRQEARDFYEIEAVRQAWNVRELQRQASSLLFDRLALSRDKAGLLRLARKGHEVNRPIDVLRDPLVIEFLGLPESSQLVESKLEQALINNLQQFLLELGTGFAFVARQQRITLDGDHFYIDLVFYHTVLKCYVLVDLKVGKLSHADLGQIQFYVNYFDRERRTPGDNPTVGLVLCSDKNDAVVKYTLGEQQERNVFATRYQFHLPTEKQLQREIKREMRQLLPAPKEAAELSPSTTVKAMLRPKPKTISAATKPKVKKQ